MVSYVANASASSTSEETITAVTKERHMARRRVGDRSRFEWCAAQIIQVRKEPVGAAPLPIAPLFAPLFVFITTAKPSKVAFP